MSYTALPTRTTADANSAADVNQLQTNLVYVAKSKIEGLKISNGADKAHDIDIAVGSCGDSTGAYLLDLTSGLTKQIDAAWSAGDDAGGIDTGSVAADTWYYIWLIRKDSDGSIDALFSLSSTAPTMPAGYTYKRRIRGAVLTDTSSNILGFLQKDDYFWYDAYEPDLNTVALITSRTLVVVSVPPSMIGIFQLHLYDTGTNEMWVGNTKYTDTTPNANQSDLRTIVTSQRESIEKEIRVDTSSQIAYRASDQQNNFVVITQGFIDKAGN